MDDNNNDAWCLGYAAHKGDTKKLNENPYESNSDKWIQWRRGWKFCEGEYGGNIDIDLVLDVPIAISHPHLSPHQHQRLIQPKT